MPDGNIGEVRGRSLADLRPDTVDTNNGTVSAVLSTGEGRWLGQTYEKLDPGGADLSALNAGAPLMLDHRHRADGVVGSIVPGTAQVRSGKIEAKLAISQESDIWPLVRDGYLKQVSLGYVVSNVEEERNNDGTVTATVTQWRPVECSLVGLAAETGARIRSASGSAGDAPDSRWLLDMAAHAHADGHGELAGRMLNTTMTEKEVREAMFNAKQQNQGDPVHPHVRTGSFDSYESIMQAAPDALRSLIDGSQPQTTQGAELRNLGPLGIAKEVLHERGEPGVQYLSPSEVARRSMHTTSDFPSLLTDAGNRSLVEAYQAARSPLYRIARTNDTIRDFREVKRLQVTAPPELDPVGEAGEIKYGSTGEKVETYSLGTYAKMFSLSRQAIINDDLGAFQDYLQQMARAAVHLEAEKLAGVLKNNPQLSDGYPVFDGTNHANVTSNQSLDVAGVSAARTAMRQQVDSNGNPLNLSPVFLVCGAADETAAQQVIADITPSSPQEANPFAGQLSVLPDARLDGEGKFWMFASPNQGPVVEIGYLNGQRGPQLESREGWNTLGIEFRVVFDFGLGVLDHRGAVEVPKA